jgi:lipoprotein-anchoring transpeptidase ErfK/SrfK
MPAHEIQSGDRLQTIAQQYDVPWQYLAKLNRVEPQRVRAGQRIKVIKGPFSAVIDLSDYELTVHAHGYFVTRYPVGIGQDGSTPVGAFTIENKLVDPTYYGPDGVVEHDDPSNPLGERWIDIGNSYGIHGTIEPDSIGQSMSRGCIRMHNDDVAAVYDLLSIGSEVTIRE